MSKRKTHHKPGGTPSSSPNAHSSALEAGINVKKHSRAGLGEWIIRLCLVLVSPALFFTLLELGLRLLGYGSPTSFFVKRASGKEWITNQQFGWQSSEAGARLRPLLFTLPEDKQPDTLRICILGESAAMGTPDPAFGFSRILEAQLRTAYPARHFEIVNAAMRGINSHAIRRIARECASRQVDLFVVYMGNNEMIGAHGADPDTPTWAQSLAFIRTLDWIKRTRTGQLFVNLLSERGPPLKQDMDYFRAHRVRADDSRADKVRANFRVNLRDICNAVTANGARLLLCTVAVNLHDCPPLGSLHRADLNGTEQGNWDKAYEEGIRLETSSQYSAALTQYAAAAKVDDHYAELHFRMARCLEALNNIAEAARSYGLARDWDALQFRTDSRLNQIIRDEAMQRASQGIRLVDVENELALAGSSGPGIPGRSLFYEHVHPTFTGNYRLASICFTNISSTLGPRLGPPASVAFPTQRQCAEYVGYTPYSDVNVLAAMVRLTSGPPFLDQLDHSARQAAAEVQRERGLSAFNIKDAEQSMAGFRSVLAREPDYWPIRENLAALLGEMHQDIESIEQRQRLVDQFPECSQFRLQLSTALLQAGNRSAALSELKKARKLDPADRNVKQLIARVGSK